ncbi:hypothetical protein SESBI_36165 [Sesbania bispinosa]|nr:hypothetical protein SESBI_36165 [Sesbania bispinosa]
MCMEVEVGLYVLFGTIIDVVQNDEWWECFVKSEGKFNNVLNASRFGPHYVLAPRYNIKVEVFDGFESCCIALKDKDVEKLMKKSFKDLFHSIENKLRLVVDLKRFCPTDDFHLFCHHFMSPSIQNIEGVVGVDCALGSSSMV